MSLNELALILFTELHYSLYADNCQVICKILLAHDDFTNFNHNSFLQKKLQSPNEETDKKNP